MCLTLNECSHHSPTVAVFQALIRNCPVNSHPHSPVLPLSFLLFKCQAFLTSAGSEKTFPHSPAGRLSSVTPGITDLIRKVKCSCAGALM